MLLELNISDFAIIDRLSLHLSDGFNVLTGETGAGKSIIIDALGTLRGDRTDPSFIRAGAERARVEGVFSAADCPGVLPILDDYGLRDDEDDTIILSRELAPGRSVARINGRAVSAAVLRDVGARLVDIHGQHEGLALFNVRTHLDMLDRYGGLLPLREQVAAKVAELRQVRQELADLRAAAARRHERIDELRLLLEDVAAARLRPGEEEELLQERALVQNGARITELVATAYALLYAGDESARRPPTPVVEAMGRVAGALAELAKIDPSAVQHAGHAAELLYGLEDLAASLRVYRDSLEFDPARLDAIEERLALIRDLQRKYRGSIADILARAAAAEAEIERLTHSDEHMAELEAQEERLKRDLGAIAGRLSRERRRVGDELAAAVEDAMRDLAMPNVRFSVSIEQAEDPEGVPLDARPDMETQQGGGREAKGDAGPAPPPLRALRARHVAFDRTGIDKVEFLLSPNPGEPLKPLARIASGGESARLLLALKSILSRVDDVPTLVFDEVDVGVGGRAGQVVGEKLWGISMRHQVICITHLPQVAAFGDAHYAIAKRFDDNRTRTTVTRLVAAERVEERAAMLDGTPVSEHSRRSAEEMLERARAHKERARRARHEPVLAS